MHYMYVGGEGRKASLIAQQYARGERIPKSGVPRADKHPTNEEVAKAVQQKVAVGSEFLVNAAHSSTYARPQRTRL